MRPRANSQSGRILALLEQGGWWSTSDLLRQVPAIVHSRIAGLRDQGYVIEHKTTGQGARHSLYRLVVAPTAGGPQEVSPAVGGAPSSSPSSPGASPQEATAPLPQAGPEPLTLFGDERSHYARESEAA